MVEEVCSIRNDIVGMDAAIISNPKVWEASGHIANFTDPLVECKICHQRFREDFKDQIKIMNLFIKV